MLRSILVVLDGSPSSVSASLYAIQLAKNHGAAIEGLGVINSAWIKRPEAVPLGAMELKSSLDKEALVDASQRVSAVMRTFRDTCQSGSVQAVATEAEGDAFSLVQAAAASHDLILLGSRSILDVRGEICELPVCIDRIVRNEPRPLMLIPASAQPVSTHSHAPILIAYDGSPASSRAVHVFALLGLAKGRVVHVLTQDDESRAQAVTTAQKACALLSLHGAVKTHAIGLGDAEAGRPAETILGTATALQPDLVVMGAYGRRGIQEIFGSCTRQVLDASTTPLFLYH